MRIKYKKFCPSAVFRAFWEQIPQYVLEHKTYKFLVDSRKMGVVSSKDQKWHAEEISFIIEKKIIKNGIHRSYLSVIVDESIFAELSTKVILKQLHNLNPDFDRNIQYFGDEKKAVSWLINIQ